MGDWYWIGLLAGLGAGIGVLLAGLAGRSRTGAALSIVLAAGAGLAAGLGIGEWDEAIAGAAGSAPFVLGSLRRGGTWAGTAVLLAAAGVVTAALALVPGLGYLVALAIPALGARLRKRAPERYAGLRTLAR